MPRPVFIERTAKNTSFDRDSKNKWRWEWVDKTVEDQRVGEVIGKIEKDGYAYCTVCDSEIKYSSRGFVTIREHLTRPTHKERIAACRNASRLPGMEPEPPVKPYGIHPSVRSDVKPTTVDSTPLIHTEDRKSNLEALTLAFAAENLSLSFIPKLIEFTKIMAKKIEPKDLGIQSAPAGFNIPKIKKVGREGVLNYLALSDRRSQEVIKEVERTCLDPDLKIRKQWKLSTVHTINPVSIIETRYREKRAEMKEQGGARLQQEVFGFYICRDRNLASDIAKSGIRANPFVKGYLGDPSHGVYLFRYLDVALLSQRDSKNACIMVFKVLQGRAKQIPAMEMTIRTMPKEPTPNFDCHLSQSAPRHDEAVFTMCSKSQMYVYEYTEDAVPAKCPRQCLPYALLEFSNCSYAKADSSAGVVDPKGVSTHAANAGWASTGSTRRSSAEVGRKVGPETFGQYSKELPVFTFPAGQPAAPPVPSLIPSDSALRSPRGGEPVPYVVQSPDSGTWRAPLEYRDGVYQPVPMEMSNTPSWSSAEMVQLQQTMSDALAVASDRLGQVSTATSAAVSRDPRFQRLLGNDRPINSTGGSIVSSNLTAGVSVGEQQAGVVTQNVKLGQRPWDQRGSDSNLLPGQSNESVTGSLNENEHEGESSLTVNKFPHTPSLVRTPVKSALKKPTVAWPSSSQADGSKKKLSFQDYLKKKKAEAQGNADGKGTTVQTATLSTSGDKMEAIKVSNEGISEESSTPRKQDSSFRKDEFQGCVYYPPRMYEQNEKASDSAGINSLNPAVDNNEQTSQVDQTDSNSKSSVSSVSYPRPNSWPVNLKSGRRDPRLHSANLSSVYSGKLVTKEPNGDDDSNSSSLSSGKMAAKEPNEDGDNNSSSVTSGKVTPKEPNEDDDRLSRPDGALSQGITVEDKSVSVAESPWKLPCDSQAKSDDVQNKTVVPLEQKVTDKQCVQQNFESGSIDTANHQVLFADLEETEHENALSMWLDDISPTEHPSERGESGTVLSCETKETVSEEMSTSVMKSVTKHNVCAPGKDEEDMDDEMTREHGSVAGVRGSQSTNYKEGMNNDNSKAKSSKLVISEKTSSAVSQKIVSVLKQGLHSSIEPAKTTEPSESLQESVRVKQKPSDENLPSPSEPLLEQGTCENRAENTGHLARIAKGLKLKLALTAVEDCKKGKSVSKYQYVVKKPESIAESPSPNSPSSKSGNVISSSESDLSLPASESSFSSKGQVSKSSSDNSTLHCMQTEKTTNSPDGKGQKSESRWKSKLAEAEVAEPNVHYAMLRLSKGLRPGKSIQVSGLGKNPTDDPLPVLEGKRRNKKTPETKQSGQRDTQVRTIKKQQKSQTVGKRTRKKRKATLTAGKRKSKKKPAAEVHTSPPMDEDIDYTDFQFEEPQEFCMSISDGMEAVNSTSGYPAPDIAVKVEPPEEPIASVGGSGLDLAVAVKTEPGTESSPPSRLGGARPLSSLGLLHWTEALLQPSLNPQVALVDFFMACQGMADFDNCRICQKVIDQSMLEEEDPTADDTMESAAEGTAGCDACKTPNAVHEEVFPVKSEEVKSESSERKEMTSAGDTLAGRTTVNLTKVTSDSREGNRNESQEQKLTPMNISLSPLKRSLVANESVTETKKVENDHSCSPGTEGKTQTMSTSGLVLKEKELSSSSIGDCSDTEMSAPTTGPSSSFPEESTSSSSLKVVSGTLKQLPDTQKESAVLQEKAGFRTSESSPQSQVSLGVPAKRFPSPRPAFSVCSQGSAKQKWQDWKNSQAQQMQQKTRVEADDLQTQLSVSGNYIDEGHGHAEPVVAETEDRPVSQHSAVPDSLEKDTHADHMVSAETTADSNIQESGQGNSEILDQTCTESSEETTHSESNSCASVQNRQNESWFETGFWLSIEELASLHRSQKDAAEVKDTAEIYSRCVSKISPTKLSKLVPGKEEKRTPPTYSMKATDSENELTQSCVVSGGKPEQVSEKVQDNTPACVEETTFPSTEVTAHSDILPSDDVENKNSESCVISKHTDEINSSDNSQQAGVHNKDVLFSDSVKKSGQEIREISPALYHESAETERREKHDELVRQNTVKNQHSGSSHAEKCHEENKVDPPPCVRKGTETSSPLKQMSEQSEMFSAVQQMGEEIDSQSKQHETTSPVVSAEKKTDFFDIVIKNSCSVIKQPPCSIPGLDLVTSQRSEINTSTHVTTANPDSIMTGVKGTSENADVFIGEKQQSWNVDEVKNANHESRGGANEECAKDRKDGKDCSVGALQNEELNSTVSPNTDLSKELDVVGTLGMSHQTRRKGKIKLRTFSVVSQSLNRKNKDVKINEQHSDCENNSTGGRQSHGNDGVGKTDGNTFDTDVDSESRGQISGCPIPSLTRARAKQKSDRRENKKQSDVLKECGMENVRSLSCESTRPTFQTAASEQPSPLGHEISSDPKVTSSGPFYPNPPHSLFHSELTYQPPMQPPPMAVNTVYVPRVPMPMPNVPVFNVPGPSTTSPVSVYNSPVVSSESGGSLSSDCGQHIPVLPLVPPPMFTVPPPPLASIPTVSMRLPPPGTEVCSPLALAPQVINVSTNLVYVTAADTSRDSTTLQTSAPSMTSSTSSLTTATQDIVEGSRDDSGNSSKIDVISWFAMIEAAKRNPPRRDTIDWFSDIIDKKNVSSDLALEPEIKKAKLEFIESLKHKKSMCDSKEKGSVSSRMSPCESGVTGKDASSRTSSKSPCEPGDRRKTSVSVNSRKSPCESADIGKKSSVSLKRQNGSGSSGDSSSGKKRNVDISRVSFKIGLSSEGINKKRGPLMKSINLDSPDSDDSPESPKDDRQQVIDEKSKSHSDKTKKVSAEDHGKSDTNNKKGSKDHDTDKSDVESCTHIGKDMTGARETNSDSSKPVANSSNRKRWHSRWDKTDGESDSKKFCAQQSDTIGQPNDTDDDMNDYAHALLEGEGELGMKNIGAVSNRISDSILKSVSSTPKPPEACDKPSIQQNSSTELEKQPGCQKESKSAKTNSSLTDKPLEFLLFAKEMIMQKLQEEEEVEEGEIKDDPGDNTTHSAQIDPVDSPKTGLLSESDVNPSKQTYKRPPSDSQCVLSKERKENKEDQPKKELTSTIQSKAVLQTAGSPVYGMTAEDISRKKDTAGQSCSARSERVSSSDWLQGGSEKMVTNACDSQKSGTERSLTSYTLNASSMAKVTEEEINTLTDIVCQLTSLPVKTASDKPPRSAEKDKSTVTVDGSEQKPKPSSSQIKDAQEDKSVIERSKPRGGSAGRDWSLFLTTARPSFKRLCAGASERRNYYGDIIEPPLYASNQESVQEPTVQSSTRESFPGSHARSHFVSKPHVQAESATSSSGLPLPGIGSALEPDCYQRFSRLAQKETGENPQTGVTKGDNSVQMKSLPVHSADRQKQYYNVRRDSAFGTGDTETQKHAASPAPSDPKTQMFTEPNAAIHHTRTDGKLSSAETVQSFAPSASSALDRDRKTLKDFLLENFPGENPNSYVHLLGYKLTADVNTMSNKMKKNILYRVRKHLEHLHTVSSSTSATPTTCSLAAPKMLLDEFAVDQIELELRLIEGCLRLMEATRAIQSMPDQDETSSNVHSLTNHLARDSDVAVKDALTVVVNDFNNAMTDTNRGWRGRPHQQIPTELLLRDEKDQLYTKEGAFMILVSSIPNKPFARLLEYKEEIEECLMKIGKAAFANQTFVLQQEKLRIKQTRAMRLQLLRTFTGSVSQLRLRKVTMSRDHYTTSHRHLLQVLGDGSVAKMVFFRAVNEAIENHLQILESLMVGMY